MTNNETEVTQALAPCPKCRSTNVCPDQFNAVTRNRWTVGCEDCDWMTATHETEAEAVQDWNRLAGIEEGKRLGGEEGGTPINVRKIETVTGDFYTEAGEPFWRIEIDGYCADFDHEQAALNFAAAIQRLAQPTPSSDEVDHLRAALEEIINPIIAMHDRAKAENCQLDGMTANILARDPEYLRQVAREALSALPTTSSTRMMVMKANRELLEAAKELRDDLLMRGERDADGTIIVNASFGRWKRFVEAIARATETPDDRG